MNAREAKQEEILAAREACCVCDQFCKAAANHPRRPVLRTKCFICGQKVCTKCSSKRKYLSYGIVRVCNDCQIESLDGGNNAVVMRRMHRIAKGRS